MSMNRAAMERAAGGAGLAALRADTEQRFQERLLAQRGESEERDEWEERVAAEQQQPVHRQRQGQQSPRQQSPRMACPSPEVDPQEQANELEAVSPTGIYPADEAAMRLRRRNDYGRAWRGRVQAYPQKEAFSKAVDNVKAYHRQGDPPVPFLLESTAPEILAHTVDVRNKAGVSVTAFVSGLATAVPAGGQRGGGGGGGIPAGGFSRAKPSAADKRSMSHGRIGRFGDRARGASAISAQSTTSAVRQQQQQQQKGTPDRQRPKHHYHQQHKDSAGHARQPAVSTAESNLVAFLNCALVQPDRINQIVEHLLRNQIDLPLLIQSAYTSGMPTVATVLLDRDMHILPGDVLKITNGLAVQLRGPMPAPAS